MTGLVRRAPDGGGELARAADYTPEQIDLLKRTTADGKLDNDQFALFMARAKATGLDPFTNQISAQARYDKRTQRHNMSIVTGIDGFRLIADRTGQRDGEDPPQWCGRDGKWVALWTSSDEPYAARVVVYRKGCAKPFYGIAKLAAYKPTAGLWSGSWWVKAPDHMLAKCAEALALRKAFPAELSGMFTRDEMDQAKQPAERRSSPRQQSKTQTVGGYSVADLDPGEPRPNSPADVGYEAEPLPTHTSQRVEIADLLAELDRKRSIAGVDKWVADNPQLQALEGAERKQVIDAYRAKRAAVKARKSAPTQSQPEPVDDDAAERAALEADADDAERFFNEQANAGDELDGVF